MGCASNIYIAFLCVCVFLFAHIWHSVGHYSTQREANLEITAEREREAKRKKSSINFTETTIMMHMQSKQQHFE